MRSLVDFEVVLPGCDVGAVGARVIGVPVVVPCLQAYVSCFVYLVLDAEVFVVPDPSYDVRLSFDVVKDVFRVCWFLCPSGALEFVYAVVGLFAFFAIWGRGDS